VATNPRDIAQARAHRRWPTSPCPARDDHDQACTCQPDSVDLAAVWQGRARMARARRAARVTLDAYDRQALDRYPGATP
jgi:hypothetical protein